MQATELLTSGPDPSKQQKKGKKRKKERLPTNILEALEDKDLGNTSESAEVNLLEEKKDKQCDVTFGNDLKASEEEKADALCKIAGPRPLAEKHNLPSTSSQEVLGEKDPSSCILEGGEADLNKSKERKSNVISSNNNLVASKEEFLTTGMVCEVHDVTLEDILTLTSQVNGNSETALQTVETREEITTTKKKRRGRNRNRCNVLENSATKKPLEEGILCTQYQTNIESVKEDHEMKNNAPSESMDTDLIEIGVRSAEVKDTSSSLEGVQNGLVAEASTSNSSTPLLNYAKRRNRRKKAKQIVCEDKPLNDMSEVDLIDDNNPVQEHVDEASKVQSIVEKCDASLDENIEVSPINSEEEGLPSSTTGCVTDDVALLDPLDLSISLDRAPASNTRRKLLILDLNGLLADIVSFQFNDHKPDIRVAGKSVFRRPFCDEFLKFCFEKFDVGVWSSRRENNVKTVVNFLMGDLKHKLLFCWGQSKCTVTGFNTVENRHKPLFLKELRKLWDKDEPDLPWEKGEYTPSNTLLLDDSPCKALRNPPYTAIFPSPYNYKNENDNSLGPEGDLRVYLEGILTADNVPHYVKQHPFGQRAITDANPSWPYYLQVIGVEHSPLPT